MKIGIDVGGTLVKIAYWQQDQLVKKQFGSSQLGQVVEWLHTNFSRPRLCLTGGRSDQLQLQLKYDVTQINEFTATCTGVQQLLAMGDQQLDEPFLLTNIGTGTSIHHIKNQAFTRISGTGLGGGTLLGLAQLLTGVSEYSEIISLANSGNRTLIDLQVKDIYQRNESPIQADLTAANFGKVVEFCHGNMHPAHYLAALIGMISENIAIISCQAAELSEVQTIVYIGSTLRDNLLLENQLTAFTRMLGKKPLFLPYGEFSGAIGALAYVDDDDR